MPTKKVAAKKVVKKRVKESFIKKHVVAIGSGVAAVGAATYYLFGPKGERHQKELKGWMKNMEADISKRLAKTEKLTKAAYHKIVDAAAKEYAKHGKTEVAAYGAKLKKQWKSITKPAEKAAKIAVKKVEKAVKTAKKSVKKK